MFVIGAGSGGVRAARMSSTFGAKVGICEDLRLGGTCVMRGCVPKKLLMYGASFQQYVEDASYCGWNIEPYNLTINWGRLLELKNKELQRLESVYEGLLHNAGVQLMHGHGRLSDAHTINIGGKIVTAENILIATGGWPSLPNIPGVEHAISSNEALDLTELPKRMLIVGGGYIGVEFAGIFSSAGVDITQVIRAPNLLRGFDQDISTHLHQEMENKNIKILSESKITSIGKINPGYSITINKSERLEADAILFATGRTPKTDNIGLKQLGVKLDKDSAIIVDDKYRSSIKNIYAIGDVTNRANLTPVAIAEAMVLSNNLFNKKSWKLDYSFIPSAVFSNPPVGTVGLTERAANKRNPVDVYLSTFRPMRSILCGRDDKTLMKLIVDSNSDQVVGMHMVGPDSPEITQGFAAAIKSGITKTQLDSTIGIHPTSAEELVTMRQKIR